MSKHRVSPNNNMTRYAAWLLYEVKEGLLPSQMRLICLKRVPRHSCRPAKIKVNVESWLGSGVQKG